MGLDSSSSVPQGPLV